MKVRKKRKKETKPRKPGGGRKQKYGEPTETVSFRYPVSKIEELKNHVRKNIARWAVR